ncbi:MAG: PAS domain-containing protein [Proteobacteria bacterium]|nr:PAS domain-containing protein [Pseudomonadota bacterium]
MPAFRLLRYFSLVSAGAFIVIVVVLMLFFRHLSVEDMIALGERQNEIVARALGNHVRVQVGPLADYIDGRDSAALLSTATARQISEGLADQIENLPVLKVSILDFDGRVVVSSDVDSIGGTGPTDEYFRAARNGTVSTRRIGTDRSGAMGPEFAGLEILCSMVPLYNEAGQVVGVFEIESDLTALLKNIDTHVLHVIIALLVALVFLYLVLYQVVRRADRTIKNQHAEMQRSTDRLLQSVIDGMPELVCVKGLDGRYLFVNRVFEAWYGTNREQAIGKTNYDFYPKDKAERLVEADRMSFRVNGLQFFENTLTLPDGITRALSVSRFPVYDEDGSIRAQVIAGRDITELKKIEKSLQQAQKMEAIGQLTGGVAHDFNNLLMVIMGNGQLLEDQMGAQNKQLQAIYREARRGGELTQRLLAFARQQPLRPQAIDLGALTSGMAELLTRTLGATIEVRIVNAPELWGAKADPGQVENALLNLCLNARDAMPDGGVLTIECANGRLEEADARLDPEVTAGDYVVLSVRDNGAGMADDTRAQAFEPFFTTKEVGQGSGLGLSMVYGFAKQSGGHAVIDSAPGRGTTVRLYLPRAGVASAQAASAPAGDMPRGAGETILVIEDDPDVRDLAAGMLAQLGYRTVTAGDAAAAAQVLAGGQTIDLMLVDVILPGGTSGPAFAEKACAENPALRVIYMSGYPAESASRLDLAGAGQVLLNKPFDRYLLATCLRDALRP